MEKLPRILFVDDEPNLLSAMQRGLRGQYEVHTAGSGAAGLKAIEQEGPFSVIVSDCRMPEMDGVEFLQRASRVAPNAVRVMLTGNVDQLTAVKAINTGDVFKFLNKPCDVQEMKRVLEASVRQHDLITAEKELLEQTLKGTIKVLSDVLGIVKPEAFGRTGRLRRKVRAVAAHVQGVKMWELDAAVLMSQLGCINVAEDTLEKAQRGEQLRNEEAAEFAAHPLLGAELISQIPRLQRVAKIIMYQNKAYDGSGFPLDEVKGAEIPIESRILYIVLRWDELSAQGLSEEDVLERLRADADTLDAAVLDALGKSVDLAVSTQLIRVLPSELKVGMVVKEDIRADKGMMLLCHGQEVTPAIREHLVRFQKQGTLTRKVLVAVPVANDDRAVG